MKKEIAIVGLGKMGRGLALNLQNHGWKVVGYNRSPEKTKELELIGIEGAYSYEEMYQKLSAPRIVWLMLPAGPPITNALFAEHGVLHYMDDGDTIIEGGNSFFRDTINNAQRIAKTKPEVCFLDVGVSGGPEGARNGACMMVGGNRETFKNLESLFIDACVPQGFGYFGTHGAGHFVKMIHNGIEYGAMQAIAEGFDVLKSSKEYPNLNLEKIANVYNHGSVIESKLMFWMKEGFAKYGNELTDVSGHATHTGEGTWAILTAKEYGIPVKGIEDALTAREESVARPNFQAKVIMTLRNMFGGHAINN